MDTPQQFINLLKQEKEMHCPCCGRYAKIYARTLHQNPAEKLVTLYTMGGGDWFFHTSRLVKRGETSIGDFTKAKYWGLIEERQNDDVTKKTSGYWRLTSKGIAFVEREISIPKHAYIFDDKVIGFSEERMFITDCFKKYFDYEELMREAA
jgi:hypothetical protein